MATTNITPITADPVPSATTDTPISPRPTAETESISISSNEWQPPPAVLGTADPIALDCLGETPPEGLYVLEPPQTYELHTLSSRNYSLTGLELTGFFYHLNGETVPRNQSLAVSFGNQNMDIDHWTPNFSERCAHFSFTIPPGIDIPESGVHGPLVLRSLDAMTAAPRILVTGMEAVLLRESSPAATPTLGGGLDSTADSSIGQSTNQTAIPASGNVPISSSSSSSPKASVLAPAIIVPVVVVLGALGAFFLWRRHRRARLAPSAAFRADHADAVEAMQRQGATVGLGGTGTTQAPTAGASQPAQSSSYFPLDEKRPLVQGP